MTSTPTIKPEPYVGARVRILGGSEGRIISRDQSTPGKWVIEIRTHDIQRHLSRWPGEFRIIDEDPRS